MPTYLQKRRGRWYAVLERPKPLRPTFGGRPSFIPQLETNSKIVARGRVGPVVAGWQAEIDRARGNTGRAESEGAFFRKALRAAGSADAREAVYEQTRAKGRAITGIVQDDGTPIDYETVFRQANAHRDQVTASLMDAATAIETDSYLTDYL